jgi:hypothetical protein
MTTPPMDRRGEQAFAAYLADHLHLPFEYEPPLGRRCPDFLVHSPGGDVLCEVKDLDETEDERKERAAMDAEAFQSRDFPKAESRIQKRVRKAAEKLREFKGRYPCLVVLFNASPTVTLIDLTVLSAMLGASQLRVPLAHVGEPGTVLTHADRYLTRDANTTISAVAILEHILPHVDEVPADEDVARRVYELAEAFDFVPRLRVFRNRFAAVPWPADALRGPHDVLWPPEPSTGAPA